MLTTPVELRKEEAHKHPETKLYLLTLSRLIRTGTTSASEPLGQMTLASYLRMLGWDAMVYSGSAFEGFRFLEKVNKEDDGHRLIAGLYADYENQNLVASIAAKIKNELGWPVFVGGPQAVGLGEDFLRKNPAVDIIIRGDGELAVADALSAWSDGDFDRLKNIAGLALLHEGNYIDNGFSNPLEDLNEAPPLDSYCLINQFPRRVLVALSGRGCPFHCSFCYEGGNSKTVRLRSVEHMLNEIRLRLKDHPGVKYIYFGDDTFTLQPDRLQAFCDGLKEIRKEHDFVWFADGHVNVLLKHPEYIRMMVDAGLVRMQIGIESCCQDIIDIYKKGIKREDLFKVVDLCLKEGLPQLAGNIIIGGARESYESARYTFETIYELLHRSRGMLDVSHTLYSNFPGTPMHRDPEYFGMHIEDNQGYTTFGDFPTARTDALSREEIVQLAKEFFTGCQKVMHEAINSGEVDEERLTYALLLQERYGITSMWITLGMTANIRRFYTYKALYGRQTLGEDTIPIRTVFFHGQTDYTSPVPSIDGFVLSPFEDELYSLCAGKLTFREITERLYISFNDIFKSMEELKRFAKERLEVMQERHLLVYTDLNGSREKITVGGNNMTEQTAEEKAMEEKTMEEQSVKTYNKKNPGKVLLFYPYVVPGGIHIKENRHTLGIFMLAAALKQAGYEVEACECPTADIMDYVNQKNDGTVIAVGLSIDYENRRPVLELSNMITGLGLATLIGGVDARTITEEELKESRAAAVLKGEGEITLPEVVSALSNGLPLENIEGLFILKDGHMVDTGAEKPAMDLDALPFPDYSVSMTKYAQTAFTIITSRGCPNHCAFCHEGYVPTKLRFRSIANVLEELKMLLENYPKLSFIVFADDTLVLRPERVEELCRGIKELKKQYHDFGWYCEADVRSLYKNPQMVKQMIDAGMTRLQIGIESGDENLLKLYGKPSSNDMVRSVVKNAYDLGLSSMVGPILVGAPFENPEHVELEKKWIRELLELAPGMLEMPISIISPYSQTQIGQNPKNFGYTFTDYRGDKSNTDYPAYHTDQMSEKDILRAYQELAAVGVDAVRSLAAEGKISDDRLMESMKMTQISGGNTFWLRVIGAIDPIRYSYLELRYRTEVPKISEISPKERKNWHLQRTMELWRFVDYSEYGPRIGRDYLSPFEYQLLLYCAGKLSIEDIAKKLYPDFAGGDNEDQMVERVTQMAMEFEDRHWVVAVEF